MSDVLVVYYSRKGENHMPGGIQNLEKGHTERAAEYLQETLGAWGAKRGVSVGFAEPAFSADNAAGIALLCRSRVLRGAAPLTE